MVTRSDRLDHVHSDIRGPLYQEALRMESEGINVLKLNTGNPGRFGFKLPNSVRQALALHIDEAVPYCDVRGMALDEAIMTVDQYLDQAILAGMGEVSIIHGKGTGVLRSGIQQHLKHHMHVASCRLGVYGEGESAYDGTPELSFGLMYHGITYADEAYSQETQGHMTANFWYPVMRKGEIVFPRPEDCPLHKPLREMEKKPFGVEQGNFSGLREFGEVE